jgi:hypothetical protein
MGGTTVNNGQQQVSIYPAQYLSSVFGNEILYGIMKPGTGNYLGTTPQISSVSYDGSSLYLTIAAGTTLLFQRQAQDPFNTTGTFIGKIILTNNYTYSISKATWDGLSGSPRLHLIADWTYSTSDTATIYAAFSLVSDSGLSGYAFSGNGNLVLIASLLNNVAANTAHNANLFHVSYEGQSNRDTFNRLYTKNEQYLVQFASDGSGLYVAQGSAFVGDNFLSTETLSNWSASPVYPGTAGNAYTTIINPPLGILNYITNYNTGAILNITGALSTYYQIDFLRVKSDEILHTSSIVWESFLQKKGSFTLSTSSTQQQIIDYLAGVPNYPLNGIGYTILVLIRDRATLNTSTYTSNCWPEATVIFKNAGATEIGAVNAHSRFKLPVWKASDLGLS